MSSYVKLSSSVICLLYKDEEKNGMKCCWKLWSTSENLKRFSQQGTFVPLAPTVTQIVGL